MQTKEQAVTGARTVERVCLNCGTPKTTPTIRFCVKCQDLTAVTGEGNAPRLHLAAVWDENYARELGRVRLRDEEINHFDCCGSVVAKIALPQSEIDRLGIKFDDYVYIRRAQ